MGNPNAQPENTQSSTSINHFSHPHPLQLSNQSPNSCSGCKLDASGGLVYSCTICNYVLHKKCSQMPQQITHLSDPKHVLFLLPKPVYAEGVYKCDACGQQGNGFSYHCQSCSTDFHILCASMPMTFIHQSHQHQLNLTFSPPYPSKTFSCDLCKRAGSNHWLYRCSSCEFDVHLTCINIPGSQPPGQQRLAPQRVATVQQARNLFTPLISQQPLYSVQQTIQQTGHGSPFQPQFHQPILRNMVTRPMLSNPINFVYSTNPINAGAFTSNLNPMSYSPYMSGARVQNLPQPQIYAQPPYARTGLMQQSRLPMRNYMNTGAVRPLGYGQQNMLIDQMIIGATNGIASGASQAITEASVQDFMAVGNATNDRGTSVDVGGFGGDMNGYDATPDVMTMDQGTYGLSDYGYEQNHMDAGIMAGEMNQMMDENHLDAGMAGADISHMQ